MAVPFERGQAPAVCQTTPFCRSQLQYHFLGDVLPDSLSWLRPPSVHSHSFFFVKSHDNCFWDMILDSKPEVRNRTTFYSDLTLNLIFHSFELTEKTSLGLHRITTLSSSFWPASQFWGPTVAKGLEARIERHLIFDHQTNGLLLSRKCGLADLHGLSYSVCYCCMYGTLETFCYICAMLQMGNLLQGCLWSRASRHVTWPFSFEESLTSWKCCWEVGLRPSLLSGTTDLFPPFHFGGASS